MGWIEALILGIIQGLTEFLPVSSSGHLEIGKAIIGSVPEEGMLMTVVLHFATALSTIVIFRKDILQIFIGLFQFKNNEELKFSLKIILSMMPAAVIGILFENEIDAFFSGNILLVGLMLIVTGGLLFLADKAKNTTHDVSFSKSFIIGVSQAIAILPGISRSGATIGTSVLLGIDRTKAARFSFLMVVPLIFGAMTIKTKKYLEINSLESQGVAARTEIIITELNKDIKFTDIDQSMLSEAIYKKELAWEMLKKETSHKIGDNRNVIENFRNDLILANLKHLKVEEVLNHDLGKLRPHKSTPASSLIIGFIAAFITGLFACTWMISLVRKSKLIYFSVYCFFIGTAAIVWSIL